MGISKEMKGYDGIFATRFREMIKVRNYTQKYVAETTNSKGQTISQYFNGEVLPNAEKLRDIAQCLGVSVDYLLGLSDVKTQDNNIKDMHNKLGLSEEAISLLMFEMRALYGMTNRKTPEEAIVELTKFKDFSTRWNRNDTELYSYAEKNGLNKEYTDSIGIQSEQFSRSNITIDLFDLPDFRPYCFSINSIIENDLNRDERSAYSIMHAIYDIVSYKPIGSIYQLSEFVDDVNDNGDYIETRPASELGHNSILYDRDIFALQLLKLQQAFTIRQKYVEQKNNTDDGE